ncbi:unnamed protein product [Echinostoma caproni]|uniref:Sushi domain-containing protein n=1 Tax=Echinostoma caproni TaxID=27848 RepID=A0A183AI17_9TREM|nr:unnamed protein product [Echinostoma caproni]
MPEFEFQISVLEKTVRSRPNPCSENWVACDRETCIPQRMWCDGISNCPQRQDEGQHCTAASLDPNAIGPDGRRIADQGKSSYELRKEQEAREAEAARLAAQKLHLSILGSLGLLLTIVTVTCVVMAIRRRKRTQLRVQASKTTTDHPITPAVPPTEPKPVRLNHIMSSGTLLLEKPTTPIAAERRRDGRTRPVFTLTKSNSIPEQDGMIGSNRGAEVTATAVGDTAWNSTDSMNAPLLWYKQAPVASGKGKSQTVHHTPPIGGAQWNHTVPSNLVFHDTGEYRPSAERETSTPRSGGRSPMKQSGRTGSHGRTGAAPGPSPTHSTRLGHTGRTGSGRITAVNSYPVKTSETPRKMGGSSSPRDESHWISGTRVNPITGVEPGAFSRKFRPDTKLDSQLRPDIRMIQQSSADQHLPSCRLISRTQSWGGGLRLAGTEPFCDGEWEVTHSNDNHQIPDLAIPSEITGYRKSGLTGAQTRLIDERLVPCVMDTGRQFRGVPVYRCREMESPVITSVPGRPFPSQRTAIHVSMPNVNGVFSARGPATIMPSWDDRSGVRLTAISSKRDFKPPSAKRPRIASSRPETREMEQWIATSYGTDTEDDFSAGAVMLEECTTVPSDPMKPPSATASSSSTTTHGSQAMAAELITLRSIKGEAQNARLIIQPPGTRRTDGTGSHMSPYLSNGAQGLPVLSSPQTSSVSEVSTDDGSLEPSNGQGIDHSESEGLYHISKNSQQGYSTDSERSSPQVILFPAPELPLDPTSLAYRPVIRRVGGGSPLDTSKPTGTPVYRTITDTGRPVPSHHYHHPQPPPTQPPAPAPQPRTSRAPSGSSVDREPMKSYVYEYEA